MPSNLYEFFYKGCKATTALTSRRKNYLTVQNHTILYTEISGVYEIQELFNF